MASKINVNGFFRDTSGLPRMEELRKSHLASAPADPDTDDFIRRLAERLHPKNMRFQVVSIIESSDYTRVYRLVPMDGHIPVFQCGQYMNLRLKIGNSVLTRPYTISSAPFEARGDNPFVEIAVHHKKGDFVPDYLFKKFKVGDTLDGSMPFGNFYWEPLRDSRNIVAIAGGSGITPFYSMAKEVASGRMKGCKLTILYGSAKSDDIMLKDELEQLSSTCWDIKIVHVLSDEPGWPGKRGLIGQEMIKRYSSKGCTYMFCGSFAMYGHVLNALSELEIPARRFRHAAISNPSDVSILPGYPKEKSGKTFQITVVRGARQDSIHASAHETVAVALERAAIPIDTHCRNGECGFCRSQLVSGEIFVSPVGDGRREADKETGGFHPCSSWPLSDLNIKIPIM